jgi:tetratricopeptide (TPR) repeat protein
MSAKNDFFDALYLLAVVQSSLGKYDLALANYDRALAVRADSPEALYNRGLTLQELKRPDEALASYDRALAVRPDYAEALYNRGNTLRNLKRLDEALASYDRALTVRPDYAEALTNRGAVLHALKRPDEALASYDRTLAVRPDHAEALSNRGVILQELKRSDEALASYNRALAVQPDYAEALYNRGVILQELKRLDEALASYDRALAVRPDYAEALYNRGIALFQQKRFREALASCDRALAVRPDYAEALNNRGDILKELNRFDEALASYDRALSITPDDPKVLNNRGITLCGLKRYGDALASYDQALTINDNNSFTYYQRGRTLGYLNRNAEAIDALDKAIALKDIRILHAPISDAPRNPSAIILHEHMIADGQRGSPLLSKPYAELKYSVEYRSFATLDKIAKDWKLLTERAVEPNVFLEPAFVLPSIRASESNRRAILIWSEDSPRRLMGLFPVTIVLNHSSLPYPVLAIWGHSEALVGTPLVDRENPEGIIEAFLDNVAGSANLPKIIVLRHIVETGLFSTGLTRVISKCGDRFAMYGRHERAYLAPTDDRNSYLEHAIKAWKRSQLRRLRQRLRETGHVDVSTTTTSPAIESALDDYLALEASGWKGRAGTAIAAHPKLRGFVEASVAGLATEGKVRIDRLLVNNRAIAAAITLRKRNKAWYWKMSYDEAYRRFSPGVLLTLELTKSLLADSTLVSVDSLTIPGHPMIDHMWRERLAVAHCIVGVGPNAKEMFALGYRIEGFANSSPVSWTVPG